MLSLALDFVWVDGLNNDNFIFFQLSPLLGLKMKVVHHFLLHNSRNVNIILVIPKVIAIIML